MIKKVKILLVDDRPEGIVTLEAVLDHPDYTLITANSGAEALSHVLNHDFAVILMDVQMPEMDGFETASIIKQREKSRNIPIIFLTAINKSDENIQTGYSVGAVDYVFKPFDPHILKSKVAVFVDLYKKNRQLQEQATAIREMERRERVRTLHQLEQEGRRRYQNLGDAIPQIVFRGTELGQFEYFNQYWHMFTGRTLDESVGLGWRAAIHPSNLPDIDAKWKAAQKERTGFECECRIRKGKDGDYHWHILRVVPEFNNLAEFVCWIGAATDIHDQKMTQEELLLSKKLAEAANETKSRFLANMSHEIRTPLGVILGFSELLVSPKSSGEEKVEAIASIRRNGEHLSKIIDEILDLSKVEAGKLIIERTEFAIAEMLENTRAFMSLSAKEKGLDLQFAIQGKVPARVVSSPSRIHQILVNIIGNAIKFTATGNILVTMSFEAPMIRIAVKDSGPGLTASQIQNLFQPFTQADTSMTRKYGGTGLGLALSRRLARALGGEISVDESKPGEGCTFLFTFEVGEVTDSPMIETFEMAKTQPKKAAPKLPNLQGIKVLLVEDSIDNQIVVSRFLKMEGAQVELANNGLEGVEKAIHGDHNLVLMDIQMPELDGYGAISQLRSQGFKKPIIALTAHGMVEDRNRCLEIGSNDHLTKPVNRMELISRVHDFTREQFKDLQ